MRPGLEGLRYHLGVRSLADVATRDDRVCVLNILGGESSQVTPVCHAFSGGNVRFGTSPGKGGQMLKTSAGDIPVFNNVREGLDAGLDFNTGVVYLPPPAVRDGVAELVRVNPELEKIVIITEKVSVHDAREIRAIAQAAKVDVFGGNCLGMADSWNRVRIGGALGGDHPEDVLLPGSIAIFSNSGGFTTTIAQYLATAGWGTTTLISSGKDVYIHYAARDFAIGFAADERSKAAVLYVEPGGYYEEDLRFDKPVIACVVGRWKSRLTRAVGHAGAIAGAGDDAAAKERWFLQQFGSEGVFTPDTPHATRKGALVTNIADIPAALNAVMALNGGQPDFEVRGDLSLKPWLANDQGLELPLELALAPAIAPEPYAAQIAGLGNQVGKTLPRQSMKDCSGASLLDPKTQIARVHQQSVTNLALKPVAVQFGLPLVHGIVGEKDRALIDTVVVAEAGLWGSLELDAAEASRAAGNSPNTVMAAAAALVGPKSVEKAQACCAKLLDLFIGAGLFDPYDSGFDVDGIAIDDEARTLFAIGEAASTDPQTAAVIDRFRMRSAGSVFLTFLERAGAQLSRDTVLGAMAATLAWTPLTRKRISRITADALPWYLRLYGVMIGASIPRRYHRPEGGFRFSHEDDGREWEIGELLFAAIGSRRPRPEELALLQLVVGLLISNGPGAISAQGAKGAVSADGPQTPARVQLNKAVIGFLTHCGYSHGGNGFEGVAFLLERFAASGLGDPTDPGHGLDLTAMASDFAKAFAAARISAKEDGRGEASALPGINHPVFRGESVNYDPRERFYASALADQGQYNVFHDYYGQLVQALHTAGATRNVFCVNVDAVIAATLLAMLWKDFGSSRIGQADLENAAFNVFLYARMIGAVSEIDDHLNRGRNMDMRTPQERCSFVV